MQCRRQLWECCHYQEKYKNEVFYGLGFSVFIEADFFCGLFVSLGEVAKEMVD